MESRLPFLALLPASVVYLIKRDLGLYHDGELYGQDRYPSRH